MSDVEDLYPLTPMQEGMLFDALYAPEERFYVQQLVCRVRGALDLEAFREAWRSVVARHPALRTAFSWEDADKPLQVVLRDVDVPFEEHDLRGLAAEDRATAIATFLRDDRARGFDLRDAPLLRLAVLRLADDESKVVWTHHHLILDGWSLPIVLGDVFRVYAAKVTGAPLSLPEPPPFRALLGWLREQRAKHAEATASAKRALEGFTRPTPLPLEDAPRDVADAHAEVASVWTAEATAQLEARARRERVTTATLLDAAWALLLATHAGTDDVVFGVTVAGRPPLLRGAATTVGNFIGTIPLRVAVGADATIGSVVATVFRALADHASHAHLSLAELKEASDVPKHAPLFESVVVVESYPVDPSLAAGVAGIVVDDVTTRERTSTPLTLVVAPGASGLRLGLLHDPARFTPAAAREILTRYEHVLRALADGRDGPLAEATLFPAAKASAPAEVIAVDTTLDAWFARTAERHPGRIAVKEAEGGGAVTYAALFRRAAGLAHALRRAGVGPRQKVGVCVDRSIDMIVSVLGVLLAGAAYVPVDVSVPTARIRHAIEDAKLRFLVTRAVDDPRGGGEPLPELVVVDVTAAEEAERAPETAPRSPDDLAYVIYTSGSTGKPKGTLVSHANVVRLFAGTERWLEPGPRDVWTLLHSIAFDFSVWELFGALLYGGTLLVVPHETVRRPGDLHALVAREGVTILNQTPSAFEAFDAADLEAPRSLALRMVIFGGEALRVSRLGGWFERHDEASPRLVNMFGITETTVHVTVRPLRREDVRRARTGESVIGEPLPDLAVEVRDARGRRVPDGVPGELWVFGAGVTGGYLERPELTAARFVDGGYRTGDRGRRELGGELVHLGRIDEQVKIRGFRIEPAEVEAVLEAHPSVRACVVVAQAEEGTGAGERLRLVAFVVPHEAGTTPTDAVRAFAASKLLRAMVPSAFVWVDALPLSVNGKVDRARLARTTPTARLSDAQPRPSRGVLVDLVASVWAELLGPGALDPDADVFDHGAHSLLATRAASRLARALDREVPIRLLFEHRTAASLARALSTSAAASALPPIAPALPEGGLYPASLAQRRLWFLDRLEGAHANYTIPAALRLRGVLDEARLSEAWERVVDRHAALRTTFVDDGGEPRQRTTGPRASLRIARVETEDAAISAARALVAVPFDLAAGPLARAEVLRWSDGEALFVLAIHHIVADGWSLGILVRDLARAYGGEALAPLAVDQPDYAAWQRARPPFDEGIRFFREALAGAPPLLDLPVDRARPARATHAGAEIPFALTLEETRALEARSRAASTTLFMTLLAGLEIFLARVSGQDDVSVGVSVAGRTLPETEAIVGFFVNLVVVRARLAAEATVAEALADARRRMLEAFAHADVPFEQVVEAIHPRRSLGDAPLFQVNFVYQNLPRHRIDSGGLALEPLLLPSTSSRFDVIVSIDEPAGGALRGTLTFRTDLFDAPTAERFVAQYRAVLAAIGASEDARVGAIRLGPAEPPARVAPPSPPLLHERIAARAAEAPERIAVVHGDVTVSYGDLLARVRRLAAELGRLGVRRGSRVAVALPPRIARVAAVLATLEVGASFVALDPTEPFARKAVMLESSGASVVLTDTATEEDLPATNAHVVVIDDACAFAEADFVPGRVAAEDLAYVIFTSGSTGTPKGVALGHGGLANLADAQIEAFGVVPGDRVLAFASFAFDASVSELAMALGSGATLDLGPTTGLRRVDVAAVLRARATTVVTLPPSLLRVTEPDAPSLRVLVAAGEPLTDDVAQRWLGGGRRVFNAYGPTETTVCATIHEVSATGGELRPGRVPIGRAMRGAEILVLDAEGEVVPVGVVGELFVAGVGVAHGYLDPERTRAAFVERHGRRGYLTGDRARRRADGTLEFLGRGDAQVKVRGHRIELGEVETVLAAHAGVVEAAASVVDDALVAYVVMGEEERRPRAELAAWVAERLPEAMVPSRFAFLDALPRTTSGKVDRRALPPPDDVDDVAGSGPLPSPPEGPLEATIAAIWSALLGARSVGRASDFFALGGHSLLAAQVTARVRDALDVDVPIALLFASPRLGDYAEAVARLAGRSLERPTRIEDRTRPFVPSYAQERLWVLDQLEPGSTAYTLASAFRLRGALDPARLSRAMDAVVVRHEVLRSRFVAEPIEARPRVVVDPPFAPALVTTSGEPARVAADLVAEPFDLARGPLFRARLVVVGPEEHVLVVAVHHAVCDARSLDLLVRDLGRAYRGDALAPLALGYLDWAAFERRTADGSRIAFWTRELEGAPSALVLGGRRPRRESARAGRIEATLPRASVEAAALRARVTPFMFLLAGYALLLARRAGVEEVVIGTPVTARPHPDTEELVGVLMNTVALRVRVGTAATVGELLASVRATCLRAYAHAEVPFERVVEAIGAPRQLGRNPVFQALFTLQDATGRAEGEEAREAFGGVVVEPIAAASADAKLDLSVAVAPRGDELAIWLEHRVDVLDAQAARTILAQLTSLAARMAEAEPSLSLRALDARSADEDGLLASWAGSASPDLLGRSFVADVLARARERPDAVAVEAHDGVRTYGELVARARAIASAVVARGGRGAHVAVAASRNITLVETLLGVVLAGAAYVPIMRDAPRARVEAALALAEPVLVVTTAADRAWAPRLAGEDRTLVVDDVATGGGETPVPEPHATAYVLFTSGSTGEPKGVPVSHASLANLLLCLSRDVGIGADDVLLALTPLSFDIAGFELWGPLVRGARVRVAREDDVQEPASMARLLEGVTVLQTTPSTWRLLLDAGLGRALAGVRKVAGGEALLPALARDLVALGGPLWNVYGPTETTIWSTLHRVSAEDVEPDAVGYVPIGRPLANTVVSVVDADGRAAPIGVPGELLLGGAGVARGYLGGRDGERFAGGMYRTGDRVRFRDDGVLVWLGRDDGQVKVRGHRLELGEVETAIERCEGVRACAAVLRDDALVAFVVGTPPAKQTLRAWLPEAAVPARLVQVDTLPRTPNGKVDRLALAAIPLVDDEAHAATPSRALSPDEAAIARLWSEVLGRAITRHDASFFELGGHSLLAVKVVARLRADLGRDVALRTLFAAPTLEAFARAVSGSVQAGLAPLVRSVGSASSRRATFAEERMWLLAQVDREDAAYHIPVAFRLRGPRDAATLARDLELAFAAVVARQSALRTTFGWTGAQLEAHVGESASVDVPLDTVPAASLPAWLAEHARRVFDLERGPLVRARLADVGGGEAVFLVVLHHVIADAWSVRRIVEEVTASLRGEVLPPLAVELADVVRWQRETLASVFEAQLAYWRSELAGVLPLALPTDRPRRSGAPRGARITRRLPPRATAPLLALAREEETTPFVAFLAAWTAVLARFAGREDVTVGVPVAGRREVLLEPLVGLFVNTLAMRTSLAGDPDVRTLVRRVRATALEAMANEDVPFAEVVRAVAPVRDPSRTPLFEAMFLLDARADAALPALADLTFERVEVDTGAAAFDLTLAVTEAEEGAWDATLEWRADLFTSETAERLLRAFVSFGEAASEAGAPALGLPLGPPSVLLASDVPRGVLVLGGEASSPAVVAPDGRAWSRRDLEDRAARVTAALGEQGVRRGDHVVLATERGVDAIAAILGIWRAGAAYVPLDPAWPEARRTTIRELAGARVVVDERGVGGVAWSEVARREPVDLPAPAPDDAAYILFTSGSTGAPKGVVVTHASVANLASAMAREMRLAPGDRVLQFASLAFDASVEEIATTLAAGATLVVRAPGPPGSVFAFLDDVEQRGVTVLDLPTAFFHTWVDEAPDRIPASIRLVVIGGEAASHAKVARFREAARRAGVTLLNTYGPTEATVTATSFRLGPDDALPWHVPIGAPIAGVGARVVDLAGRPVPIGAPGELALTGAGVARGYLDAVEATRARFVDDGRTYLTGDRVRLGDDGQLEFLGRLDRQLKVRGHRIEPGEIESALTRAAGVREAVVDVRVGRLVAWVALERSDEGSVAALATHLRRHLPEVMIPALVVVGDALPKSTAGKVDRARLPDPQATDHAHVAARTALEKSLAAMFSTLLGVASPSMDDDFFALGGHSLLATQLLSRIRVEHGVDLPVRAVFESATIEGLAAVVEEALGRERPSGLRIPRRADQTSFPLSHAQERLYFLDRLAPGDPFYVLPSSLELRGPLDVEALRRAFEHVVARHEVLRATFHDEGGVPVQRVAAPARFELPVREGTRDEALALAAEDARTPFVLSRGPLVRAGLVAIGERHHVLVASMHHIVSDGWSTGVLLRELAAAYAALSRGALPHAEPLPIQYADFAAFQRASLGGAATAEHVAYFRRLLAGAPALLALPTDRPRPPTQSFEGADVHVAWPPPLAEGVRALAQAHGATPFMVLLAAFQATLARIAAETDVVIGASMAGRDRIELEPLVGFFVNIVVLRGDLHDDPSFATLVERTRAQAVEAFAHRELPFDVLVDALGVERTLAHAPVFQVNFVLQNAPDTALPLPGIDVRPLATSAGSARFDLALSMTEGSDGIGATFTYRTDLFDAPTVERMARQLRRLLTTALAEPDRRLSTIPLDDEVAGRAAPLDRRSLPPVHLTFAELAASAPDRIALRHADHALSYADLDREANRLAHHLRASGVRPGARIAIATDRTPARIVAILAAWKAGAAYVPVDLANPVARISAMLEDAAVDVAIADDLGEDVLPTTLARVVAFEAEAAAIARCPGTAPDAPVGAEAYVLFTSGSTGRPKGVAVDHAGLANLARAQRAAFTLGPDDVVLQFASLGFDASVSEITTALTSGASLDLGDGTSWTEGDALERVLARRRITCLTAPPSLLRELSPALVPDLRVVVSAGEACDPRAVLPWVRAGRLVLNAYGPTEATVCATIHRVTTADRDVVPIGTAMEGVTVHVRGPHGEIAPRGAFGLLAIGGVGVARGYVGQAAQDPVEASRFSGEGGERVFVTGDRVRDRGDGVLVFAGRADDQVKLRGFRVEPGEIEAALRAHPEVTDAAVVVRALGTREALVAFVVASDPAFDPGPHLEARLPPYMVPARFVVCDALPKTSAGKTDRAALRARPLEHDPAETSGEEPRTDRERALAAIWRRVLGVPHVGPHDNFFALGGDSIASLQVVASAAREGLAVTPKLLFEHQTLAAFAAHASQSAGHEEEAAPANGGDRYPLTPLQEGMLFHALYDPTSAVYVSQLRCLIRGPFDAGRFEAAWRRVTARHTALRTSVSWEGRERAEQVVHEDVALPFRIERAAGASAVETLAEAERARGFDLREAPLFRILLVRLGDEEHELVWTHHHLVLDGWSVVTVVEEVLHFTRSDAPLPPALPYRAYVDWLARVDRSGDEAYWREALGAVEHATPLPIGGPSGRAVRRTRDVTRRLSRDQTSALSTALRASALTPSTLVTAAWAELLGRLAGRDDVLVGVTVAGRPAALAFGGPLVGLFLNTLPLAVRRGPEATARSWLESVQRAALAMREHEHASLPEVARLSRVPSGEPLFESIVVFENFPAPAAPPGEPGAPVTSIVAVSGAEQTSYPLTVVAAPGEELELRIAFDEDRFDVAEVASLLEQLATLVVSLSARLERPVSEAAHLAPDTRRALLVAGTASPPAAGPSTVPEAIDETVARVPSSAAIVDGPRTLTYRDLDAQADLLAGALQRAGVEPRARVAVLLERSAELVVAFLAVWRAGGVVVPLDPSHPPSRRDMCMQDARVAAVVARAVVASSVPTVLVEAAPGVSPVRRAHPRPDDDAYVLYTSGSTGRPKGVVVAHAALASYLGWAREAYAAGLGGATALHTSPAFDLTLTSLLLPLVAGGRIDVVAEGPGTEALAARLRQGPRLGLLKLTPSHLAHLLATLEDAPSAHGLADVLVLGGEALLPELARSALGVDPRARVWNEYGPTEACIGCVAREVTPEDTAIGYPIPGTRAHVLDAELEPVPLGVAGDLWLGGACLARGYLGRPEETARAFVETPHGRLYRTGDRARLRHDGVLVCLGRADDQVKVRGHRVELGEVEHALAREDGVREAAAALAGGRLVAWVVPRTAGVAGGDLRARVRQSLPEAFVPAEIHVVEALPLAPSGKVDRAALVASLAVTSETRGGEPPSTDDERTLAAIWERVIGRAPVLRDDDFFACGGDSILALQVVALARQASLIVTPRLVFEQRTLAAIAAHAVRRSELVAEGPVADLVGTAPVTPVMEWFFARGTRTPAHYNQSVLFAAREGALDVRAFEEAFVATLDHHGLTRTRLVREAPGWTLRQGGAPWRPAFRVVDLSDVTCTDAMQLRVEELAEETQRALSLDPDGGRLAAALVVLLGPGRGVRVQIAIHHLVVDAVSWTPLLGDLAAATLQRARGGEVVLPPVPAAMLHWARALDRRAGDPALRDELPFWHGVVVPEAGRLPRRRPVARTNARARVLRLHADAALLGDAASRLGCRLHELVLAALGHVLCAWAGHEAVVVDVEGHGREPDALGVPLDLSRAVGFFTVVHPLRLRARHATLAEDLLAVRDAMQAVPSGGLGYGLLRWRVRDEALVRATPADVSFNFLGRAPGEAPGGDPLFGDAPESRGDEEGPDELRTHALEVTGRVVGTSLGLEWAYDPEELGEDAVRDAARRLEETLAAIARIEALPTRGARKRDPLVLPLASGGAKQPLFLVHPVGGAASCYANLARALGDRPVHGLEAVGLHDGATPLASVEAMAARYVEAVRHVQPAGPWLVGGWSMGALVATEMARLLALGGGRADVVAIDQLPSEVDRDVDDETVLARIAESIVGGGTPTAPLPGATHEEQLRALLAEARARGAVVDETYARRHVALVRAGFRALAGFRPRPFAGRVLVLRAEDRVEGPSTAVELEQRVAAAAAEWAALAEGGVTVRAVPGDHLSLLRGDRADATARALREGLEVV